MVAGFWCLTEILMSPKPTDSRMPISNMADSTSASGVGPPCLARISFCSDPALTPTRIGTSRPAASCAISFTLSCFLMLPGLMRTPAQPASRAAIAYFHWKWMSATTGMVEWLAMAGRAAASSVSGTATRTMSQPVAASSAICCRVALTSAVLVIVIDWTLTGAPPPTGTLPTWILRERRRPTPAARSVISSGKATEANSFVGPGPREGPGGCQGALFERVGDRVGDVEPDQADGEHDQQDDDAGHDRGDLAEVDRAPGRLLPEQEAEVAAVHRGDGEQVEQAHEDVELDEQEQEGDPLVGRDRVAGELGDADDADHPAAARAVTAAGRLRPGLGPAEPVEEPGDDPGQALDRAGDQLPEQRPGPLDARDRPEPALLDRALDAEEAAGPAVLLVLHGREGGGPPLAVALVGDLHRPARLVGEGGAQLLEAGDRAAVHGHDAVACGQPGGLGRRLGAVRRGGHHLADAGGDRVEADRHQHEVDQQQRDQDVGDRPGREHDRPLPGRLVAELPLRRGGARLLGPGDHGGGGPAGKVPGHGPVAVLLQEVAVAFVGGHARGLAEAEEEALDLHPEQLRGHEVATLVEEDGQHQGEDEQQDAEQATHAVSRVRNGPRPVYGPGRGTTARRRERRRGPARRVARARPGPWPPPRRSPGRAGARPGTRPPPPRWPRSARRARCLRRARPRRPGRAGGRWRGPRGRTQASPPPSSRCARPARPTARASRGRGRSAGACPAWTAARWWRRR